MRLVLAIIAFAVLFSYISYAQSCDYKVEILVEDEEFEKDDFKWKMRAYKIDGKPTNITGTAKIEDSNGKAVKRYRPWTNLQISKQKTSSEYSPNLKESEEYTIKAEIEVECEDTDKSNNIDAKTIKIKNGKDKIEEKEEIVKDTENKKIASVKAPNVSIAIKKAKTPKTALINESEKTIYLRSNEKQNPNQTQPQIVYVSSSEKAKGLIMVFLLILSILLNIILIWRR